MQRPTLLLLASLPLFLSLIISISAHPLSPPLPTSRLRQATRAEIVARQRHHHHHPDASPSALVARASPSPNALAGGRQSYADFLTNALIPTRRDSAAPHAARASPSPNIINRDRPAHALRASPSPAASYSYSSYLADAILRRGTYTTPDPAQLDDGCAGDRALSATNLTLVCGPTRILALTDAFALFLPSPNSTSLPSPSPTSTIATKRGLTDALLNAFTSSRLHVSSVPRSARAFFKRFGAPRSDSAVIAFSPQIGMRKSDLRVILASLPVDSVEVAGVKYDRTALQRLVDTLT